MAQKESARRGGPDNGRPGEVRLPATVAVIAAALLTLALPDKILAIPRFVVPVVELALLLPLALANPLRMTRENRRLRVLSLVLGAVLVATSLVSFILLIRALVESTDAKGTQLLLAALEVWITNIIAFGIVFWELDRGGPVRRRRSERSDLPTADFRFSQDEDDDAVDEVARASSGKSDWRPGFIDYLYTSVTNSTAFSPTDTMPLSPRAKSLMALESIQALMLSILVIARAIGQLK